MTDKELKKELDKIRKGMRLLDTMIHADHDRLSLKDQEERWYLTERQRKIIQSLFDLFQSLNWQIALNSYKKLIHSEDDPINTKGLLNNGCGTPVKVRPCNEKYGNKTYFGILIGDVPLSIGASIDEEGNLTIKRQMYNPAIFVPELKEIIYGCGSWWSEIESEDDLNKVITDETIENVWYVKALKEINK